MSAPAEAAQTGAEWLVALNAARTAAGLAPIVDNRMLSDADARHAQYLVKTRGRFEVGAQMHDEDPSSAWYTAAGQAAGKTGDVIPPSHSSLSDSESIETWLKGPFHALPMLDPELRDAGFGRYCEAGWCAAVLSFGRGSSWSLNGTHGVDHPEHQRFTEISITPDAGAARVAYPEPIEFPGNGAIVKLARFTGGEWPNPLSACAGYSPPTGSIILVSLGRDFVPKIDDYSLSLDGRVMESCLVTADSYRSTDQTQVQAATGGLTLYAAALIVPREPLAPGHYRVALEEAGKLYQWGFTVAAPDGPAQSAAH